MTPRIAADCSDWGEFAKKRDEKTVKRDSHGKNARKGRYRNSSRY
jgi:hypothetical protein